MFKKEKEIKNKSISLIFPAWDEERYVKKAVLKAIETLESFTDDYEIIIINDGSRDRTKKISEELVRKNRKVRLLNNETNQKLGVTLRKGIGAAKKDLIVYSDIDLPFDLKKIKDMVEMLERKKLDIVVGIRPDRYKKEPKRAIYSFFYNSLIKILFWVNVKDINCPAKLFKRDIFNDVKLKSKGSFIDAEMVIKSLRKGYKLGQIKLEYFPRIETKSRASDFKTIIKILEEIIKLYPEVNKRS